MFLGLSAEVWIRILLAAIALLGIPGAWFFGKRQEIAASREKTAKDADNARRTADAAQGQADAAQQNSDIALMNMVRQAGVDSLKTLLDGAKSIGELTEKVQQQGEQLGRFKYEQAQEIGALKLQHAQETGELRSRIQALSGEVALLRSEIAVKDAALAECAECRKEKETLERENATLKLNIVELERAQDAFIFLWQSALDGKADEAQVNIAEAAIKRILLRKAGEAGSMTATEEGKAISAVATTYAGQTARILSEEV